jgi:hypothetical protein
VDVIGNISRIIYNSTKNNLKHVPLPHFTQLINTGSPGGPGTFPDEVVYMNLFECTFILPTILQAQGRDPILMLQNATNIDLNLTPSIDIAEQRFKYSTRVFLKTPTKTHVDDLKITFNVNVNQAGSMETWNTLKAWYDLVWNSQNGYLHYKADIIGTLIVNQHDKKGVVLRRVTFQNVQIKEVSGASLKWDSSDIWSADASFVADYWIDEYIDNNFTITPPLISGYPNP